MISPEAEIPYADFVIETWIGRRKQFRPGFRIRVNSIHPGATRTTMAAQPDVEAVLAASVTGLAIPRIAEPEELTRLVLFVASDEASFSTGSEFIADGGALLGPVPDAN